MTALENDQRSESIKGAFEMITWNCPYAEREICVPAEPVQSPIISNRASKLFPLLLWCSSPLFSVCGGRMSC